MVCYYKLKVSLLFFLSIFLIESTDFEVYVAAQPTFSVKNTRKTKLVQGNQASTPNVIANAGFREVFR